MENQDAFEATTNDEGISLEEMDDVEAHGLKELGAAVGAAAVIAGGVAAMTVDSGTASAAGGAGAGIHSVTQAPEASANVGSTGASVSDIAAKVDAAVAKTTADVSDVARRVSPAAGAAVKAVGDAASHTVHASVNALGTKLDVTADTKALDNAVDLTDSAVGGVAATVNKTVDNVKSTVSKTVDQVNKTVDAAKTTVKTTTGKVTGAVKGTLGAATTTVKNVESSAIHIVSGVRLVNGNWTIGFKILGTDVHTNALNPTGLVTITDAAGHVVGSTTMHNGAGTIEIANASSGAVFTLHYPGDAAHGSATLQWVAPHA